MKTPNCTTKEFFVIKENRPVGNATKKTKQIFLDAEYKIITYIIPKNNGTVRFVSDI